MAALAAHLVDSVITDVPTRQWPAPTWPLVDANRTASAHGGGSGPEVRRRARLHRCRVRDVCAKRSVGRPTRRAGIVRAHRRGPLRVAFRRAEIWFEFAAEGPCTIPGIITPSFRADHAGKALPGSPTYPPAGRIASGGGSRRSGAGAGLRGRCAGSPRVRTARTGASAGHPRRRDS